ncbi:unnamed protein product [Acanthoscelides obtectus]|uniref:Uncharacterized protein n=1 Tax=Acanthoscelides obtectus TaxID=200917 RepID=A0A9P0Q1D3_ACAOB|nr:unnamed protein product [Acanthoscelides obtectus]CAK1624180.1 hypothetical protein AOBTE_LOCUS2379 [Acanthoscelides obtectus]
MSSQVAAQEHEVVGGPSPGGNYLFQEPIRFTDHGSDDTILQASLKVEKHIENIKVCKEINKQKYVIFSKIITVCLIT